MVSYETHSSVTCLKENETRQSGLTGMAQLTVHLGPALSIDAELKSML